MTAPWQVYQMENRQHVANIYNEHIGESAHGISLRNQIAREQYSELESEERECLRRVAKEKHEEKLHEYERALEGQPVTNPDVQRE